MATYTIFAADGSIQQVSLKSMLDMLTSTAEAGRLLRRLAKGDLVEVELKRGAAKIIRTRPEQDLLTQDQPPVVDYSVSAELLIGLPASIKCRATSDQEAKHIIDEVVTGQRGWPTGMHFRLHPDDVVAVVESLKIGNTSVIRGIEYVSVQPALQLAYERGA